MEVRLLVCACVFSERDNCFRAFGENIEDSKFSTVDDALLVGKSMRRQGICVIVRPTYNEVEGECRFFREWRSFDGGEFQECQWYF